jgi:exonuclease III
MLRGRGLALILAGDWNVSQTKQDTFPRLRTEEPHALARRLFAEEFVAALDLVDVYRQLHPEERAYTWFNRRARPGRLDAARVDFILMSRQLIPSVECAEIVEAPDLRFTSDHAPVFVRLQI